jgi:nitrous oxidase accessory protein NosD
MRKLLSAICIWGFMIGVSLAASPIPRGRDDQMTLIVDDDKVQCPTAEFTKIQDAINAAPAGATIRVCAGTYKEQLSISKALVIRGDNAAIVMPTGVSANTTSLISSAPIAAVILVAGTDKVTLENLTVDGANNGLTQCAPNLIGIYFRNASGEISDVAVRNTKLAPSLNGCQSGLGIFVQSGSGSTSRVEIEGSSVHDFQKNGITGNEAGTHLDINRNVVTGVGPTSGAAQNGIQVAFGAAGSVQGNSVANLIWSPCISAQVCQAVTTGILVLDSDDVRIGNNSVDVTQGGVFIQGGHGEIEDNSVFDTMVFDGISIIGDRNEVQRNIIVHSDEAGVFVQGNNNYVNENRINEAPIGVLKISGSSDNAISGNRFFNTLVQVQDPPGPTSTAARQPFR